MNWYMNTNQMKLKCDTTGQLGERCLAYEEVDSGQLWNLILLALTTATTAACTTACVLQYAGARFNPIAVEAASQCVNLGFSQLITEAAATVAMQWPNLAGDGSAKDSALAWVNLGALALGIGAKGVHMSSGAASMNGLDEMSDSFSTLGEASDVTRDVAGTVEDATSSQAIRSGDLKDSLNAKVETGIAKGVAGGASVAFFATSKIAGGVIKNNFKNDMKNIDVKDTPAKEAREQKYKNSKKKKEKIEACVSAAMFTTILALRAADQGNLPKMKADLCRSIQSLRSADAQQDPCAGSVPVPSPSSSSLVQRSEIQVQDLLEFLSKSLWINQSLADPQPRSTKSRDIVKLFQACQADSIHSCALSNSPMFKYSMVGAAITEGQMLQQLLPVASDVSSQLKADVIPRASDLLSYSIRNQQLPDSPDLPLEGLFKFADLVQDNAPILKQAIETKLGRPLFNVIGFRQKQNVSQNISTVSSGITNVMSDGKNPSEIKTFASTVNSDDMDTKSDLNLFQVASARISKTVQKWTISKKTLK